LAPISTFFKIYFCGQCLYVLLLSKTKTMHIKSFYT
jgi:hypothetical protein